MKKLNSSKRGNAIIDTIMVIIVLVVLSVGGLLFYKVFGELNTDLQADADISAQGKAEASSLYSRYPSSLDGLFAFIFVGLWGLVMVASYYIDSRPIFFIFTLILLICVLTAVMFLANFYEDVSTDAEFSSIASSFPITNWVMSHFLTVALTIGASIMLVLFGKSQYG